MSAFSPSSDPSSFFSSSFHEPTSSVDSQVRVDLVNITPPDPAAAPPPLTSLDAISAALERRIATVRQTTSAFKDLQPSSSSSTTSTNAPSVDAGAAAGGGQAHTSSSRFDGLTIRTSERLSGRERGGMSALTSPTTPGSSAALDLAGVRSIRGGPRK